MSDSEELKNKIASAQQQQELMPLVEEYLIEVKSPINAIAFVKDLSVVPIRVKKEMVGFWGLAILSKYGHKVANLKAFYLQDKHREHRDAAADDLIRLLTKEEVTHLEIWAFANVQDWLTKRYGIKPRLFISQAPIETFQIYK